MNQRLSTTVSGIVTMVSVVLTPLVGALGPFQNGQSDPAPRQLFLPADFAFTIWGVNYAGLFALGAWLLLRPQAGNPRARAAAPWLAATSATNVVWIFLAGQAATAPWTLPVLVVMEVFAWLSILGLVQGGATPGRAERWLRVPLRVYVGWLSVATIANAASALDQVGWNGWGIPPVSWTLIMIAAATALAWVVGRLAWQDNVYRAVFVWAFVGIAVQQAATPAVAWAALVAAVAVAGMIAWTWPRGHRQRPLAS